jgi:hypothetical protein
MRIALVLAGLAVMPVGAVEPSGQPPGNSAVLFSSLYPSVVIAQAPKTQPQTSPAAAGRATVERTIGVCQLIENPPIPALTAANVAAPAMAAWSYLTGVEKFKLSEDMSETAKTTLLDGAKHGELKVTPSGNYRYHPTTGYYGTDRATVLVEMGNYKVKVVIHIKVMQPGIGGTEGYDPYMQKENCPKGPQWKISQIAADFGADDLLAWQRSAELSASIEQTGSKEQSSRGSSKVAPPRVFLVAAPRFTPSFTGR